MLSDPFTEAYFTALRARKFDWLTPNVRVLAVQYLTEELDLRDAITTLETATNEHMLAYGRRAKQAKQRKLIHAQAKLYAAILQTDPAPTIPHVPPPITTDEELAIRAKKIHATRLRHRYRIISKWIVLHTQEVERLKTRLQGLMDVYDRAKAVHHVNQNRKEKARARSNTPIRTTDEDKAIASKYVQAKLARRTTRAALRAAKAKLRTTQARFTTIKDRLNECINGTN